MMGSPLIGVLGCAGAVGGVACNILHQYFDIRGGQRSPPSRRLPGIKYEWMKMDLYDPESLAGFCAGCDVVLNCAGPSCLIGNRVALAAKAAGAWYVDVFGADVLSRSLSETQGAPEGLSVIAAGVFPGLSAVLPLWLAAQGFEKVDSISGFAGGREYYSVGAASDFLLSSQAGFGIPDAYWCNGAVCKYPRPFFDPVLVPGFRGEVYVRNFFHGEMIRLAKQLKLCEARWHNVYTDKRAMDAISKYSRRLSADDSNAVLEDCVNQLVRVGSTLMSGKKSWYTMTTELQGTNQGKIMRKRAVLRTFNSYQLSGIVAATTVQTILTRKPADGVHWAFEVLNPNEVISKIQDEKAVDYFDVFEVPPLDNQDASTHFDEGVL